MMGRLGGWFWVTAALAVFNLALMGVDNGVWIRMLNSFSAGFCIAVCALVLIRGRGV